MERGKKSKTLLKIFITTLYLSAFTFGGGYVIVSLMKKKFVDENHWIEQDEMLDLVAIAQSSPGPIAINGAIAVGYKLCGMAGTLVAIIGTIIPPFVIISIISYCYSAFRTNWVISEILEGMQAGVAAVIASVTYDMGADIVKQKDDLGILFMIAAFVASYILEINVVFIVIVCGLVGVCRGQLETVVLLSKGEIDSKKVRVEFSLEDMDMSGFQKGATYEQIKAYVLEHTGLKVSSLYISQIKRKCGLDVGQNYNLSKKEDAKVPKCPPEKEAAIRDALKYFQMI